MIPVALTKHYIPLVSTQTHIHRHTHTTLQWQQTWRWGLTSRQKPDGTHLCSLPCMSSTGRATEDDHHSGGRAGWVSPSDQSPDLLTLQLWASAKCTGRDWKKNLALCKSICKNHRNAGLFSFVVLIFYFLESVVAFLVFLLWIKIWWVYNKEGWYGQIWTDSEWQCSEASSVQTRIRVSHRKDKSFIGAS